MHAPTERADEPGSDDEPSFFAEINITPLTDVVLVLLIIFMVASGAMVEAARSGQLGVELPTAGSGTNAKQAKSPIVVDVLRDGRIAVSGELVDDEELLAVFKTRHAEAPGSPLLIEADGELAHKKVVHVIDVAQKAGFSEVGIAVAPEND